MVKLALLPDWTLTLPDWVMLPPAPAEAVTVKPVVEVLLFPAGLVVVVEALFSMVSLAVLLTAAV